MNGPYAFPFIVDLSISSQYCTGMTLRDYFAAEALGGMASAYHEQWNPQTLAAAAYELADAMLMKSALIPASVDLLAELQAIADANPKNWDAPHNDTRSFQEWAQNRARAAVAKATGGAL